MPVFSYQSFNLSYLVIHEESWILDQSVENSLLVQGIQSSISRFSIISIRIRFNVTLPTSKRIEFALKYLIARKFISQFRTKLLWNYYRQTDPHAIATNSQKLSVQTTNGQRIIIESSFTPILADTNEMKWNNKPMLVYKIITLDRSIIVYSKIFAFSTETI